MTQLYPRLIWCSSVHSVPPPPDSSSSSSVGRNRNHRIYTLLPQRSPMVCSDKPTNVRSKRSHTRINATNFGELADFDTDDSAGTVCGLEVSAAVVHDLVDVGVGRLDSSPMSTPVPSLSAQRPALQYITELDAQTWCADSNAVNGRLFFVLKQPKIKCKN